MTTTKIAVVTGGNKGIGYGIVKGLCEKYNGSIYLTARDKSRGEAAVNKLKELGFNPLFHQLDITEQASIDKFKEYIVKNHGGIDILINNAGIYKDKTNEYFLNNAEDTLFVNYFGTLRVCETLFPILRSNARVIHVSSSAGRLARIPSADLRSKLSSSTLTVLQLNDLMNKFLDSVKKGKNSDDGWGDSPYVVSKVGVSALAIIQQRDLDQENPKRNILVNSCHPGYVDTDMTDHKGVLTIEEGAKAALYLALEPHNLRGQYLWYDTQVVDWTSPNLPSTVS